jgi:FKBP-type peptidyl-prolyl cis-trans isomerase
MRVLLVVAGIGALLGASLGCQSKSKTGEVPVPTASASARRPEDAPPALPPADAKRTPSGLATKVLRPGRGEQTPHDEDAVRVHFVGWNAKGKRFEDTRKKAKPMTFGVTSVIAGWKDALELMKVGEKLRVWVPDDLGYPGRPGYPRGPAVFDIELLAIVAGSPPPPAPKDVATPPKEAQATPSGLTYLWLERGRTSEKPRAWDRVKLDYAGWRADGTFFEGHSEPKRPAVFDMLKVIPGWAEALSMMSVGDRMRIWLPEALAYRGRLGRPKGPLVFDLSLRDIERQPEPPRPPKNLKAPPKGATTTASGLAYLAIAKGKGTRHPSATSHVEIHYSGWTANGELFDSSVARGHAATVPLDHVIPGWQEALQKMVEGDRYLVWIPERLAYGGKPGAPRGALIYEIELEKILR